MSMQSPGVKVVSSWTSLLAVALAAFHDLTQEAPGARTPMVISPVCMWHCVFVCIYLST